MHQLETTLAQLQLRAAQLADKRALAEAALASATAARQVFRLEGDLADDKLDSKLQNEVDLCRSKLSGLDADIVSLQAKITQTEQQLSAERNAAERKAASEKLARDLDAVEKALPTFLEAARRFTVALEELHHNFEATQMATFVANMTAQVETAAAFALAELRGTVPRIADGSMPIPPAKPEPAPVAPPPAPVAQEAQITYSPIKTSPRFKGAVVPTPKLDPVLAAANIREFDRGLPEREITIEVPRF